MIPPDRLTPYAGDPLDVDDDELPDAWELTHGFSVGPNAPGNPLHYRGADPDHDGLSNAFEWQHGTDPNVHGGVPGYLLREVWDQMEGFNVEYLVRNERFSRGADHAELIASARGPVNAAYDYGQRMRGLVVAPESGTYMFYIAGDNQCELWLSPTASGFDKSRAAFVPGYTGIEEWDKYPMQTSVPISLTAGQKIYIEVLHKQGSSEDHVQVGWQRPNHSEVEVMDGQFLESYAYDLNDLDGDEMPSAWELAHGLNPEGLDPLDPDGDGIPNALEYVQQSDPQQANQIQGALSDERWLDFPGRFLRDMVGSRKFYGPPDRVTLLTHTRTPRVTDELFGRRVRGTITPAITGAYTFWALGDEEVEVWLSPDDQPFGKKLIIRTLRTAEFDEELTQKSQPVQLIAGQKYYIEALQKDEYGLDVFGLAWTDPNGDQMLLPTTVLSSFVKIPQDLDDDSLPDVWETQVGLDAQDNGLIDLEKQGERGDFDDDGLINRYEYLIGSDPKNPDTDGDGELDGVEFYSLRSNVLAVSSIQDVLVDEVELGEYQSPFLNWIELDGGWAANGFRGATTWNFTVPSDGHWLMRIDASLMNPSHGDERIPLRVEINGMLAHSGALNFGTGRNASLQCVTPWLAAGPHQATIHLDNALARRQIMIRSISIYQSAHCQALLDSENRLHDVNPLSRTSPVFIEGVARDVRQVRVNGQPVRAGSDDHHWYTNVPLNAQEPTSEVVVQYEPAIQSSLSLSWQPTNIFDQETLVIRQGDALLLCAQASDAAVVSIQQPSGPTLQWTPGTSMPISFPTAGTFTYQAQSQTGQAGQLTVQVVAPPSFSIEPIDLLGGRARSMTFDAAPEVVFEVPTHLASCTTTRLNASQARVAVHAGMEQSFQLLARLAANGAILATQPMNNIMVFDALQSGVTFVNESQFPGYHLVQSPLTALNFPSGARIEVLINRSGVLFADGAATKTLFAADFVNDSTQLDFLFPASVAGGYCHSLKVFDRHGTLLGLR